MSDESTRREPSDDVATLAQSGPAELPPEIGSVQGRYIRIEEIGRGGMGAVVRAYDPKLEREVALKLVRREVLDDTARQRVIREARAMAKLSHPNVVAVYDVEETDDGELMLVMELVVGKTLRHYAKSASTEQILHALRQAGQGLAAAHEAGLLHRDFKPDNVLVGDDGRVRVTDFGLAKVEGDHTATDDPYASQDLAPHDTVVELTEAGVIVGTPRYMAPEQHDGAELSASTDQYGFCVAAWELLAGRPPFSGPQMKEDKRVGPPGWDHSQVVLSSSMIAALRRGMAPEPADRFASMTDLLAELRPDTGRRGRWIWAALGTALVAGTWWQVTRLSPDTACTGAREQFAVAWGDERRDAVVQALHATDVPFAAAVSDRVVGELDSYAEDWIAMHHDACEATAIRGEQSEQMLDLRMACLRRVRERVRAASQVLSSPERETLEHAYDVIEGLPKLDECADLEALSSDTTRPPKEIAAAVEDVDAELADADALLRAGLYEASEQAFLALVTHAEEVGYEPTIARVKLRFGDLMTQRWKLNEGDALFREALRLSLAHEAWDTAVAAALSRMYLLGAQMGEAEQARALRPLVEGILARTDRPRLRTRYAHVRSSILGRTGKLEEALELSRDVVALRREQEGDDSPLVADALINLTSALIATNELDAAQRTQAEALRISTTAFGPTHPSALLVRAQGAAILRELSRFEEALEVYEPLYEQAKESLGDAHLTVQAIESGIAQCLDPLGRLQEAEVFARRAVEGSRKTRHGHLGTDELEARLVHSQILAQLGRNEQAQREAEIALERAEELFGGKSYRVGETHLIAANAYSRSDPVQTRRHALAAAEILDATVGPAHPNAMAARRNLAALAVNQGDFAEAEVHVRKAIAAVVDRGTVDDALRIADLRILLAVVLHEEGQHAEALEVAEGAYQVIMDRSRDPVLRLQTTSIYALIRWAANVRREELPGLVRAALADAPDDGTAVGMRAEAEAWLKSVE